MLKCIQLTQLLHSGSARPSWSWDRGFEACHHLTFQKNFTKKFSTGK